MLKIRVLVVDDSVVIRRLVTHALGEDEGIEVVGSASNGVLALQKIEQVKPDVVTLDIEMPEMNGIETLKRIRASWPRMYVIMFSTLTQRGAASTVEALTAGANDYVTKAANVGALDVSIAALRAELVPKIRQFFLRAEAAAAPVSRPVQVRTPATPAFRVRSTVLAIGVSTGGPNALADIIGMFPENFPLPVLIVQHMPPMFTKLLADRLSRLAKLRVEEGYEGAPVEAGRVYIAPGNYHMYAERKGGQVRIRLDQAPPENSCRPAVDVLFRSVAETYRGGTIAAVLTGMGQDGYRGSEIVKAAGGYVIAQDEGTSVVWGMPGFVARAGLADRVVPLGRVVPSVIERTEV